MAWLSKRPQVSEATKFYTLNVNKSYLIVGLGNVGSKYDLTRHNIGFYCLDKFKSDVNALSKWTNSKKLFSHTSIGNINASQVILIKPITYMNLSGQAVEKVINFYNIPLDNVLVIYDDIDIDFGQIRLRKGGTSAGHKGVESIINKIGQDFSRIRIGIGPKIPPAINSEKFVLQKFNSEAINKLPILSKECSAIINEFIFSGELLNETRSWLI